MINNLFNEYKDITIKIIDEINKEAETECLFELREEIIKEIIRLEPNKETIQNIYNKLASEVDIELKKVIINEQVKVKDELRDIHNKKNANNIYGNNINKISLFNRTI